ncbi:MAG: HAD-IA family hydrolase [Pseudomonadota bacterium]
MVPITTLLLDADGVVQQPPADWRQGLAALCGQPGAEEAFLADVFRAEGPALRSPVDFAPRLAEVLERWRSPASVEEALLHWHRIEPDGAVLSLVSMLRERGTVVGLATNQQRRRADYMIEALGYAERFDGLFFSYRIGYAKPETGYFEAVLAELDRRPEEVLFLDDHEANVDAARSLGLAAEVFELSQGIAAMETVLQAHGLWETQS